jgi:NADH-quinone oxidoreductase subunit N
MNEIINLVIVRTHPFGASVALGIGLFITIFFSLSQKDCVKRFIFVLNFLTILASLYLNIYSYVINGRFASNLFLADNLQIIQSSIILYAALHMLIILFIFNHKKKACNRFTILFLFSVISALFIIYSRNFTLLFVGIGVFLISIFLSSTSQNACMYNEDTKIFATESCNIFRANMRFFISSLISFCLIFFGFSLLYGSTDFNNFLQIIESQQAAGPLILFSYLIFGLAIYFYMFIPPFHGPYLVFHKRADSSSQSLIWFLYFPVGLVILLKFNDVISFLSENFSSQSSIAFLTASFMSTIVCGIIALSSKSIRKILSLLFILNIGFSFLSYSYLAAAIVSRDFTLWLNVFNLFFIVMNFIGVFVVFAFMERNSESEHISSLRGLYKKNLFICINITIMLLSFSGMIGTVGFVYRFTMISPVVNMLVSGTNLSIIDWITAIMAIAAALLLLANVVRILIVMFKRDEKRTALRFSIYQYIYVLFFTLLIIFIGVIGLLEIMNNDASFLQVRITDPGIFIRVN